MKTAVLFFLVVVVSNASIQARLQDPRVKEAFSALNSVFGLQNTKPIEEPQNISFECMPLSVTNSQSRRYVWYCNQRNWRLLNRRKDGRRFLISFPPLNIHRDWEVPCRQVLCELGHPLENRLWPYCLRASINCTRLCERLFRGLILVRLSWSRAVSRFPLFAFS